MERIDYIRQMGDCHFITALGPHPVMGLIDKRDWPWASKIRWSSREWPNGISVMAVRDGGKWRYLHREVATRAFGPCPGKGYVCEHINGDQQDNRRVNLQWVLRSQTTYARARRLLEADAE